MKQPPLNIALVTSWFGRDLKGGAEQQAWQIATRLAQRGLDVTVLTTCSQSHHHDWDNAFHREGANQEAGITIRRFAVNKRSTLNKRRFDRLVGRLLALPSTQLQPGIAIASIQDEVTYCDHNIASDTLLKFISDNHDTFDAFLFLPYLFPVTLKGITRAAEKAILQPCLHNECYAYLNATADAFHNSARILFNSVGEQSIAQRLFGSALDGKASIIGEGVEVNEHQIETKLLPNTDDAQHRPFILYLGKRCREKNVHHLINWFGQRNDLKLIIAGADPLPIQPQNASIIDLGMVDEARKQSLLHSCSALVNLSENESFSRVIYEAWWYKKPVIVHRQCPATAQAVVAANNAGWQVDDAISFNSCLDALLQNDDAESRGQKGYHYATEIAHWDKVIDRYCTVFESLKKERQVLHQLTQGRTIIVMGETIARYDAVGNDVIACLTHLKNSGFTTFLYGRSISPEYKHLAIDEARLHSLSQHSKNQVIFHHSTGWKEIIPVLKAMRCRKILRYHNVTPPQFFENFSQGHFVATQEGYALTRQLIEDKIFDAYLPCSHYNANELKTLGAECSQMQVLAPFHKLSDFRRTPINRRLFDKLDGDAINVLFVGRFAPNKGHRHLVETISAYVEHFGTAIHLHIVGNTDPALALYVDEIKELIHIRHLDTHITICKMVEFVDLVTYFKAADVFLFMSEHEGFGVPILEAQFNRLPVIALDRCANKDTAGPNQLVFSEPDYKRFAAAIYQICHDETDRNSLIEQGLKNVHSYEISVLKQTLITFACAQSKLTISNP